jgi:thiol:disulfide interchange protein
MKAIPAPQSNNNAIHSTEITAQPVSAEQEAEAKRQLNAQKQFKGFIFMAVGAFIGFMSCVLTIAQVFPQWYSFILYGLTIIGITLAFIGLYFVLE